MTDDALRPALIQPNDEGILTTASVTIHRRDISHGYHPTESGLVELLQEEREASKQLRNELIASESQVANLRQQMRQLEAQKRLNKERHQVKLDSVRHEAEESVQAARCEVEQLRLEMQRLKRAELGELSSRRGRDSPLVAQTPRSEVEKTRSDEDKDKLKSRLRALEEALATNAKLLDQKGAQEMQLRDSIRSLVEQHRRDLDENQRRIAEANRRQEKLSISLSEQRMSAEQQLRQAAQRLEQSERKLQRALETLRDNEKMVSEINAYSASLKAELDAAKRQVQEALNSRDQAAARAADQLRSRLSEEAQRSKSLADELSKLKQGATRLKADLSHSAGQMAERERDMQRQLAQLQQQLGRAEDAAGFFKGKLDEKEAELKNTLAQAEQRRSEREELKARLNSLIDTLAK